MKDSPEPATLSKDCGEEETMRGDSESESESNEVLTADELLLKNYKKL